MRRSIGKQNVIQTSILKFVGLLDNEKFENLREKHRFNLPFSLVPFCLQGHPEFFELLKLKQNFVIAKRFRFIKFRHVQNEQIRVIGMVSQSLSTVIKVPYVTKIMYLCLTTNSICLICSIILCTQVGTWLS